MTKSNLSSIRWADFFFSYFFLFNYVRKNHVILIFERHRHIFAWNYHQTYLIALVFYLPRRMFQLFPLFSLKSEVFLDQIQNVFRLTINLFIFEYLATPSSIKNLHSGITSARHEGSFEISGMKSVLAMCMKTLFQLQSSTLRLPFYVATDYNNKNKWHIAFL